ncbi:xanthine dehydrogenase family protein molybdopterin-binding subunit [Gaiella sp.]|uniref:xanthine dehydrogenase family protein molybdopterin-binding subunit n=1 Tax=Gaiella sp. TaxID=2663207 RepID=UPI0039832B6A
MSASSEPWVGRPLQRFEDDALLRGEGRFLDDLSPVAHSYHAAVVRSQLAHARIEVDASAALDAPGVIGVLVGADVMALSRPFPAGIDSGVPQYATAIDTVRYVGEPIAVVVARDRYLAEDAAELVDVDYDQLDAVLDPVAAAAHPVHERDFAYGDVATAMAQADLVLRQTFHVPRFTCTPVECYAVVADWDATAGRLTTWANFQGPFTLHGVAAAALGLKGDHLRLLTPPDSGGSFGVKSSVFAYIVLMGLASRHLGVPVTWIEDRLEHLASSAAATGRTTEVEAGFTTDGRLIALRYDAIEDVGAYVRAPEPATLYRMHGSLSGAYTVPNVAVRNRVVLTNTQPSGLNRGFGGPQLYFGLERTMAIAARRLGIDPAELARRNLIPAAAMPYRTPSGALYDSGDYAACLDHALELADYAALRTQVETARADCRLAGIGLACIVEPSISNMGYITLAQTADERALTLPKSGNAEGASISINPLGGITVRLATTPQGQGHRTVCAQVVADTLGCTPDDITVLSEMDTASVPWTVASGSYSSRFSGVAVGAVQAAALKLRAKIDAIRAHAGDDALSLRRVAGMAHWNPEGLPAGEEPGLSAVAFWAPPTLDPPDDEDRIASSASHGFIVDICAVDVERETGEVRVLDYITVHDAGRLLNPLLADGQVMGGFTHGLAAALYERHVYDEWGNLMTASLVDYLTPTAPDIPALTIGHLASPSPVTALGAKGIGEGNTMSAPVCVANAVADAIARDDVELPLTPPRVWQLLNGQGAT